MRRAFSNIQRLVLAELADWKCQICGCDLRQFHADHIKPWSKGGPTTIDNGQALCPPCNLKKGDRYLMDFYRKWVKEARLWQREAMDRYEASQSQTFLLCATPGAGKTRLRGDGNPTGANQYEGTGGTFDNVQGSTPSQAPTGNTSSAALRRLRKDRPDLHARVLDGELSPHAAAVKAGFRPKTYTIPHDPERVARKLVSVFSDQELMLIGNLIAEMKGATA